MIDQYSPTLCFPSVCIWEDLLFVAAKSPYMNLGTLHFIWQAETKTWCAVVEMFPRDPSQVVCIMLTKHCPFICIHAWIKTTPLADAVNEHHSGDAVILCRLTTCCWIRTVKARLMGDITGIVAMKYAKWCHGHNDNKSASIMIVTEAFPCCDTTCCPRCKNN